MPMDGLLESAIRCGTVPGGVGYVQGLGGVGARQ
jgi:hypothetical protein